MNQKLCIMVCENFAQESKKVIELEGFDDVHIITFPAKCGHPPIKQDEINSILKTHDNISNVVIIGSFCLARLKGLSETGPYCSVAQADQCFHMLADKTFIDNYAEQGSYLLTPGWLNHWRERIETWGFNQKLAREFFKESSQRLVLLDTGTWSESGQLLKKMADFVDRPFKIVPVGLGFFNLFLTKIVLKWRLENENKIAASALKSAKQELSGFAMSFDMIGKMSQSQSESEVIENIVDIFNMLFAPKRLLYLPLKAGIPGQIRKISPSPVDETATITRLMEVHEQYAWTKSEKGFLLNICYGGEKLGTIEIDDISFPQHKEHYLNLGLNIVDVCGLAIENARKYEQIKANLIEKETLLKEIHHRVKNNLTVISSLLNLQANSMNDKKLTVALMDSMNRVQSMSSIHEALYQSENLATINMNTYLSNLTRSIARNFSIGSKVNLYVEAENISIGVKQASPIGLVINELITNTFKYAFPDNREGEIKIRLQESGNQIALEYSDNGVGIPEGFNLQKADSLGLKLVSTLVENQLNGTVDIQSNNGTKFTIKFNIES